MSDDTPTPKVGGMWSTALCTFWVLALAVCVLVLPGCTTTKPTSVDPLAYKTRAKSSASGGVTVRVAVPAIVEAQAIYGVELASKHIQPVWVEVKNETPDTYWFLPSGLDPAYYSPSEAAFAFHTDSEATNRQLDEKFRKLQFHNPVRPGSTEAGFVLVNLDEGFKAIDIDLISREAIKNFSFISVDPEFRDDFKQVDFETLYAPDDIRHIEDEKELRRVLEELPCCTINADGDKYGDPLSVTRRAGKSSGSISPAGIFRPFGSKSNTTPINPLSCCRRPSIPNFFPRSRLPTPIIDPLPPRQMRRLTHIF